MALPQLFHEKTVRQHDEVHVPGLALAVTQLTIAHTQLLLAIPMKGFRSCPTMPVTLDNAVHLPVQVIRDQDDPGLFVVTALPENKDANFVIDVGNPQRTGEVPLLAALDTYRLADRRVDASRQF